MGSEMCIRDSLRARLSPSPTPYDRSSSHDRSYFFLTGQLFVLGGGAVGRSSAVARVADTNIAAWEFPES